MPNNPDFKLQMESVRDLLTREIPPVKWFVPDLIPEGLTLLAGPAKVGKSFLAWNIALAVATGGLVLQSIEIEKPRNVIYMAMEDPDTLLKDRLNLLTPDGMPSNCHIAYGFKGQTFDDEGLGYIEDAINETYTELLIVDTWRHVKPNVQLGNSTSYDDDYAAMIPVQRFAHERNIAVILITHTTKMRHDDNPFDQIQGSTGMQAGCDTMLMLMKEQHTHVLHTTGRRMAHEEHALSFDKGLWTLEGSADDFNLVNEQRELLEFIRNAGAEGLLQKELVDLTGRKQGNVSISLSAMLESGVISRHGVRGRYYVPLDK